MEHVRATQELIAKKVGRSRVTVSNVLNGGDDQVSKETAEEIRLAARDLRYEGRSRPAQRVALIAPSLHGQFFGVVLEQLQKQLANANVALLVGCSDEQPEVEGRLAKTFARMGVKGIITIPCSTSPAWVGELIGRQPSLVFLDRSVSQSVRKRAAAVITLDQYEAGRQATDHLINEHHCRRVACVAGPEFATSTTGRREGWKESLAANDLSGSDLISFSTHADEQSGYEQTLALLDRHPDIDGIVYTSDSQAVGGIRAATELGIRTGSAALRVVSIDGTAIASFSVPSLTTWRQPMADMCSAAVRSVLGPPTDEPSTETFTAVAAAAESCGCVPRHRKRIAATRRSHQRPG